MRTALVILALPACTLTLDDLDGDGFTPGQGDCDDLDPSIHPDAPDSQGDGIDQNCDGVDPLMRVDGTHHSCTLATGGDISCSGDNSHGQLEWPETDQVWIQLAAGAYHTCALDNQLRVTCWGDNRWGQSSAPSDAFVAIDAGSNYSIGILETNPEWAKCWGLCLDNRE